MSSKDERRPGHLWALVQAWMDSMPYPPRQRKLAERIKVSPSVLSQWKYGDGFPNPENIKALAAEIGVPYEKMLDAVLKDQGYRATDEPPPSREVRGA